MVPVLIANGLWLAFLSAWCIAYYLQRGADVAQGGRYPAYVPPPD